MIKNLTFVVIFTLVSFNVFSQNAVPQTINYQGVARTSDGKPLASTNLLFKTQIFTNNMVDYFEIRAIKTNALGAYTFQIGDDKVLTSSATQGKPLANINWGTGEKTINVSYSTDNGNSYASPTNLKISSVPYALHALKSVSADDITIKVNNLNNPNAVTVPTTQAVVDYVKDISGIDIRNMILADGTVPMKADLNLNNQKIINVATPTNPKDAVNKAYVDEKVGSEAPNAVTKALNNNPANPDEQKLQDAVKNLIKKNAEDITQNDQLNNFITLNKGNDVKGAVLVPVQIGFDRNSFNKATASEVLAKPYNHDNNAETPDANPLADGINSLNPWRNINNVDAARVRFNSPVTNFAGVNSNVGLQVNSDLTVQIGNFRNAGEIDFTAENPGSLSSFHVSTDGNGNLATYKGQIEPVKIVTSNSTLGLSDYLVYANGGDITLTLPANSNSGRINGRMYQITALSGNITLSEGYKSIATFTGAEINRITTGNSVKLIFVSSENAWVEVK